jgi:hypothetical protein
MVAPPRPPRKRLPRPKRAPRKPGPKPHVPTEQQRAEVRNMVSILGLGAAQIAKVIGVGEKALRQHYAPELELSRIRLHGAVGQTFVAKCLGGTGAEGDPRHWTKADTTALIWFTKTQMGWSERTEVDVTGGVELRLGRDFKDI